jgi:EmrB/QacA subfamily drug resistance transporter
MNREGRLILLIAILASFIAFLDGSVINVALPAIARDLGGGLTTQQWAVDAYLLTQSSLMLVAGSLSDLFGRKRVLAAGLIGFGVTSVLCAIAPSALFLIIARALQGVAGALLVPSSLALIISHFSGEAQGKAIGTWTAWTGMAFLVGPLVGGSLVDLGSWRLIFAINIVPIAVVLWLMNRLRPDPDVAKGAHVDMAGAALCTFGLGLPVYALIEQPHYGWSNPFVAVPLLAGIAALTAFLGYKRRIPAPMLPLKLFKVRNFTAGNFATIAVYAGLSIATFLISVAVQQLGHYSALQAGLALVPVTVIMFFLSSRFGALAGRFGPRLFMSLGPTLAALGFLTMLRTNDSMTYWSQLLPGVLLFGLGLSMTVAPLTSAVLGSISAKQAGIGSAINNAVARIAGLVAIAGIGLVTGPSLNVSAFHRGIIFTAFLLFLGGAVSWVGIRNAVPRSGAEHIVG